MLVELVQVFSQLTSFLRLLAVDSAALLDWHSPSLGVASADLISLCCPLVGHSATLRFRLLHRYIAYTITTMNRVMYVK